MNQRRSELLEYRAQVSEKTNAIPFHWYQPGHSMLQVDHFIVGSGGTTWGQYQQAMREVATRAEALDQRISALVEAEGGVPNRLACLSIEAAIMEFERLCEHVEELSTELGELTPEKVHDLDRELWLWRTLRAAGRDLFIGGRLSPQTGDLLLALPNDLRAIALDHFKSSPDALIQWTLSAQETLPCNPKLVELEA